MSEINELYQEVILDHNREPRNFQKLAGANRQGVGYNPLCGDKVTVYLKLDGDRIQEVSFLGSGCAISKASASMMTTSVKGKTREEIGQLFEVFHKMVTGKLDSSKVEELGKLKVFAGVSEFPARVKCATLAWHTLEAALEGKGETVSTEKEEEHGSAAQ
jgi:nitrogen fixation NifU-like protein